MRPWPAHGLRLLALMALCALALQLSFALRIGAMAFVNPQSTSFQRSEAWRLLAERQRIEWSQQWVDYADISAHLKRAVIASEDAGFAEHSGVEWDAIEQAWEKNQRAEARAEKAQARLQTQAQAQARNPARAVNAPAASSAKVVGGSTITQQLAKNLFLSGE